MKKEDRFHEIDLLRFAAAFSVLLYHYTFRSSGTDIRVAVTFPELAPIFKYGYLGVELFFVISGFVVLLTALGRNARQFVVSRATRLYPAYWSCVAITFVTILLLGGDLYSATFPQFLVNLTMLQEFAEVSPIDGVYWTLTIELKFYLLVFLLVLARQIHHLQQFLGAWLLASAFLDYFPGYNAIRFFLFPGYSYFFIAGAAFLLIRLHGISPYRLLLLAASYVGALHFGVVEGSTLARFFRGEFDPLVIALILSLFFGLFYLIALGKTKSLGRPGFIVIGALTYPLYLLHQRIGFMLFNALAPHAPRYVLLAVVIMSMIGLAYAVHRLIERRYAGHLKRFVTYVLLLSSDKQAA